jgi:endonuclease VIII
VPEGDALHRAAERLRVLEGEVVAAKSPHPRAAGLGIAARIDGRRLQSVQAVGKHLLLTFEGGLVLRSHLRTRGRWRVERAGSQPFGTPWLVLRGREAQAVLWHGPVLELAERMPAAIARLGPDIMGDPPAIEAMLSRLRATDQSRHVGEALLDQALVAGIGNMWKAESLFDARISPWLTLADVGDGHLRALLTTASGLMKAGRGRRAVYRRAGLPCRDCGTAVRSQPQGEQARTTYWCPTCQAGTEAVGS